MIRRAFTEPDNDTFLRLYKTFIRPHLEYANVIWNPYLKRQSVLIEQVQRRATKILKNCKEMSYAERLRFLNLHSLKGRRLRGDLIQMFKIYHGIDDIDFHKLFISAPISSTRNSAGKIFVKHANSNKRLYSFCFRIVKPWNDLPEKVKFSKTVNEFKNRIDKLPQLCDKFYCYDE